MPRRIAIVTQAYHPTVGGVTEHVDATARVLRSRGHQVTVVTSGPRPSADEAGVIRVGRNLNLRYNGAENNMTVGLSLVPELQSALERGRFDLVHVHCPIAPVLPLLAIRLARVPVVGTFHSVSSDLPYRLFGSWLAPFYRRLRGALAVSEAAREYIGRHFDGRVDIVPNGVDLTRFRPGIPPALPSEEGVPTILYVGRFDPRKGLPELIQACTILARDSVPFRLVLVGDGALRPRVERMARNGPLRGRVRFEGRVGNDRLPAYYASADVFCSPARGGESFGLVLLEAMACGVPVVATDLPGYRSVVTHDQDGEIVAPRDALGLAIGLERVLRDPRRRARMRAHGIEKARRYGWVSFLDRLEAVYDSILAPKARPRTRAAALRADRVRALTPAAS
ncbi:MAG TPA: glycosyltransferase family 4 protein [Candidatus Eisenbacteria bacterium]|nr:glycosyltransferase family 4 protein [Candidatus Eisenbacteria bacterium]